MRNMLTMVCVLAVAACADDPATNDNGNSNSNRTDAPDASKLVALDAASDAQQASEPDAGEPDAGSLASDAGVSAGDAGAGDASADSSAPAPVVLTQASYQRLWDSTLASTCWDCHTYDDHQPPVIDFSPGFGVDVLLRASRCNGMPYVTPGDPSRSLLWRVFQSDAPCGVHPDTQRSPPMKPSRLDPIAAWIRGELETR
jgi:hypothetical protein